MKTIGRALVTAVALLALPLTVSAHCDAVDGPVATVAVKALETGGHAE